MRIAEILENITSLGPLSPADYAVVAQKRDADLQKKQLASKKVQDKKQQSLQKKVWASSRPSKHTKFKSVPHRQSKPRYRFR